MGWRNPVDAGRARQGYRCCPSAQTTKIEQRFVAPCSGMTLAAGDVEEMTGADGAIRDAPVTDIRRRAARPPNSVARSEVLRASCRRLDSTRRARRDADRAGRSGDRGRIDESRRHRLSAQDRAHGRSSRRHDSHGRATAPRGARAPGEPNVGLDRAAEYRRCGDHHGRAGVRDVSQPRGRRASAYRAGPRPARLVIRSAKSPTPCPTKTACRSRSV